MPNEFIIKNGYRSQGNSEITGSLTVTGGITGSLQGTSSWANNAISSSYALISSYSLSSNEAANVVGWGVANIEQINIGESSTNSYNYMVNAQELEQSKHATINIFNSLNFI
jgi:hypothetical protein